jgi:hypothetical protein
MMMRIWMMGPMRFWEKIETLGAIFLEGLMYQGQVVVMERARVE